MAEAKPKKKRQIKKSETIRQQAVKAGEAKPKPRRIRRTVKKAGTPVKAAGRGVTKVARPFSFLLWPFRTRPARFIGRILSKVLLFRYFASSWQELRLVVWPDRRTTLKLTLAVFIFAISFSLIVAVADYGLDKLFKQLLV